MDRYEIKIEWDGPFSLKEVVEKMDDAGKLPDYGGEDYGLYQIYGKHILCGENTLLYIGKAVEKTFAIRFRRHKKWLDSEENIKVYLGRVYDPERHSKKDNWESWRKDVEIAEKILIYKYSPNYNARQITKEPDLESFKNVRLIHTGKRHRLEQEDNAPKDYVVEPKQDYSSF